MTALADTSVLIDVLRGAEPAVRLMTEEMRRGRVHASEITRLEVLAGMRPGEEAATTTLLGFFRWHAVDRTITESAGALGRRWLPSHHTIDAADLAIAATALALGAQLLTRNVRHFPMFEGLAKPY